MPALLSDDGDLWFDPTFSLAPQPDRVGMNNRSFEGTPLAPFGPTNSDRAYARTSHDTNDNAQDFVMREPSGPQNATFCGSR